MDNPMQGAVDQIRKPDPMADFSQASQAVAQNMQAMQSAIPQQNQQAAISRALAQLKPNSKAAQAEIGKAIQSGNYSGYCLQYLDDLQGNKNRQPTAIADYQVKANNNEIRTNGIPPEGSRVYFAPTPDNPAGHVGLSLGGGVFRSATDNGIKDFKIGDWEKYASQQFIGWAK